MSEKKKTMTKERQDEILSMVRKEAEKGNICFIGIEGIYKAPIDEFLKQPTDGILYDLNRLPECIGSTVDIRCVNDYGMMLVVKKLKEFYDEHTNPKKEKKSK